MTPPAPRTELRFKSLDGLRGVAAILVALCHFITAFQPAMLDGNPAGAHFAGAVSISQTPLIFFYNPDLCISIFFILSGFVLASSAVESGAPLHALIARRWVRLALPICGAFFFAWAVPACGLNFSQEAAAVSGSGWLAQQYAYISLSAWQFTMTLAESAIVLMNPDSGLHRAARVLIDPQIGWGLLPRLYNSNLWTMPIEFAGSIGLFIIYRVLPVPRIPLSLIRAALLLLLIPFLWRTQFLCFPAGALLFELYFFARHHLPRAAVIAGGTAFGLGLLLGGTPFQLTPTGSALYRALESALWPLIEPFSPITFMHEAGAFCLVIAAIFFTPFRSVLESRAMQWLGRISFMVYLLQVPLLCAMGAGAFLVLNPRIGYNMATLAAAAAYFAATLAAATLFARFIDIPAIHASRRLANSLSALHLKPRPNSYLSES